MRNRLQAQIGVWTIRVGTYIFSVLLVLGLLVSACSNGDDDRRAARTETNPRVPVDDVATDNVAEADDGPPAEDDGGDGSVQDSAPVATATPAAETAEPADVESEEEETESDGDPGSAAEQVAEEEGVETRDRANLLLQASEFQQTMLVSETLTIALLWL